MVVDAWTDPPAIFDWDPKLPDDWDKIVFRRTSTGMRTLNGIVIGPNAVTTTNNFIQVR